MKKIIVIVGGLSLVAGISAVVLVILKKGATQTFDFPIPDLDDLVLTHIMEEPPDDLEERPCYSHNTSSDVATPHTKVKPMETGFSMNPP